MHFSDIVHFVDKRWSSIKVDKMTLRFRIHGYSKCMLKGDGDIDTMVLVCNQVQINRVDVEVTVMETDDDSSDGEDYTNPNGIQRIHEVMEDDCEPNFFGH